MGDHGAERQHGLAVQGLQRRGEGGDGLIEQRFILASLAERLQGEAEGVTGAGGVQRAVLCGQFLHRGA